MSDRVLGFKMTLVAAVVILVLLKLVAHIWIAFLTPVLLILVVAFVVLTIGSRMLLGR